MSKLIGNRPFNWDKAIDTWGQLMKRTPKSGQESAYNSAVFKMSDAIQNQDVDSYLGMLQQFKRGKDARKANKALPR